MIIAIALACEPGLPLADEPTTALDVSIQAQILASAWTSAVGSGTEHRIVSDDLGVIAGPAIGLW